MVQGLVFDLDGVIVDTARYHYMAWAETAGSLGISFTPADNERLKGVSRRRSLEILLELGGIELDEAGMHACCAAKNQRYLQYIEELAEGDVLPGVRDFLQDARVAGFCIALGTASRNSGVILERLGLRGLFDAVVDGNMVAAAKPDPAVFLQGAHLLGLTPAECLVFEDAAAGVEAARRAGMRVVGIGSRNCLPGADLVLPGFEGMDIDGVLIALEDSAAHPPCK